MKLIAILLTVTGCAVFAADTQVPEGARGAVQACRADAKKLCADVKPGEGRIIACLKENSDKVSDACKAKMEKLKDRAGKDKDDDSTK